MKQITFPLLCCVPAIIITAQYKPVDSKSTVKFTIKNFGIGVTGTFTGVEGEIIFDPKALADAYIKVTVRSKTVNTGNELRDSHLKDEDYFDTAHYPRISFESSKIAFTPGRGMYMLYGKLTIKNHTEDISFPFTEEPSGDGYLFTGTFTINRRNFGVGGFSTISENADITLSVFAGK
jgi:polyisoprenoid-binding protein YceI